MTLIDDVIGLIAPHSCAMCGRRLAGGERMVCASCLMDIPRTGYASAPYDNPMAQIFWGLLPIERCAAWFRYSTDSATVKAIHAAKYYSKPQLARFLGALAAQEFAREDFFNGIDLLVPMPLARNRQRQRGYNQSVLIARGVASVTHLPMTTHAITRDRFRSTNTHLSTEEREANVKGVFHLRRPRTLRGKHLLLIDDVVTTGATMLSLGEEVMTAGDVRLSVMAIGFTHL